MAGARAVLMQVLVKAGAVPAELGPATRAVLATDPGHVSVRHNFEALLRAAWRWPEGGNDTSPAPPPS